MCVAKKYLKDNKQNSIFWCKTMLGYLSLEITCICSSTLTVFRELAKLSENCSLLRTDKLTNIFLHQMETIVDIFTSLQGLSGFCSCTAIHVHVIAIINSQLMYHVDDFQQYQQFFIFFI